MYMCSDISKRYSIILHKSSAGFNILLFKAEKGIKKPIYWEQFKFSVEELYNKDHKIEIKTINFRIS